MFTQYKPPALFTSQNGLFNDRGVLYGANNKLWLDASETSTITESAGNVSRWNDKSGNGNNAIQASGSLQPQTGVNTVNGKNAITFAGENQRLVTTYSWPLESTIFVVCKPTIAATDIVSRRILTSFVGTGSILNGMYILDFLQVSGDTHAVRFVTFGGSNTFSGEFDINQTLLFRTEASADADTTAVYVNNELFGSGGNTNTVATRTIRIGEDTLVASALESFGGEMCEIILFDTILSDVQTAVVENYLNTKWGA